MLLFILFVLLESPFAFASVHQEFGFGNYDGIPYNVDTHQCCAGTVVERGNHYMECCGNSTFDVTEGICCDGVSQKPRFGLATRCCGRQQYNIKQQLCCFDTIISRPSYSENKILSCCGRKAMDTSSNICCNGNIIPLDENIYTTNCCGYEAYNYKTHVCCYEDKSIIRKNNERDTDCCNGEPYSYDSAICCNGNLYNISMFSNRHSFSCCGDYYYNYENQGCCEINGDTFIVDGLRCCGSDLYEINSAKCCGTTLYPFRTSISESCCGEKLYDYTEYSCCNGELYAIDEGVSCCTKYNRRMTLKYPIYRKNTKE